MKINYNSATIAINTLLLITTFCSAVWGTTEIKGFKKVASDIEKIQKEYNYNIERERNGNKNKLINDAFSIKKFTSPKIDLNKYIYNTHDSYLGELQEIFKREIENPYLKDNKEISLLWQNMYSDISLKINEINNNGVEEWEYKMKKQIILISDSTNKYCQTNN